MNRELEMLRTALVIWISLLAGCGAAHAFEPYTHNFTGDRAREDALDGSVTIAGREYPVTPQVLSALRDHPAYFDAGVIGPDVLPDIAHGWYLVHTMGNDDTAEPDDSDDTGDTGEWLGYLLEQAWRAQADASYSPAARSQILAFTYGFLTHPAGDMWAHTLVNDFARGRWPTIDDVFESADNAVIPLRHKIVEAYIGDATPGFDGNPGREPGHSSDDVTAARAFAVPHRFVYRTLIDPRAITPGDDPETVRRGALVDAFLRLRHELVDLRDPSQVSPIREALDEYEDTRRAWDEAEDDCNYGSTSSGADEIALDIAHDTVACPIAMARLGITAVVDSYEAFLAVRREAREAAARRVFHSYLSAWIGHIDLGLEHWSELGLAILRAQFDPAARRRLQDRNCAGRGAEDNPLRIDCEDGIAKIDVVLEETEDFTNDYLLAMLGLPQFVGDTRSATDDIRDEVRARLATLAVPFDPILAAVGEIRGEAEERILNAIRDATGLDLDEAERFKNPTHWLVETAPVSVTFPSLGTQTVRLFDAGDHERLDDLMGLAGDHHVHFGVPFQDSTGLSDEATLDRDRFPPVANTILNAKLLLLDGDTLNRVLGDVLVDLGVVRAASLVKTYQDRPERPANLMVDSLAGAQAGPASAGWWLRDINSDHAWRADAPAFALTSGGTGGFPIWESCVLRPAFRALYQDWENGEAQFPDLGDGVSPDLATDPEPPRSELEIEGDYFDDGARRYVSRSSVLRLASRDTVFADGQIRLRYRVYTDPAAPGPWIDGAVGTSFSLEGTDGVRLIDFQAEDPCHTFARENGSLVDPLPPEPIHTEVLLLARFGTDRRDVLIGTKGDDVIVGMGGNDLIVGLGGNDLLQGATGNDVLIGNLGDDLLLGHDGTDKLMGQQGDDVLDGGEGGGMLHGGPGRDSCSDASGASRRHSCESQP